MFFFFFFFFAIPAVLIIISSINKSFQLFNYCTYVNQVWIYLYGEDTKGDKSALLVIMLLRPVTRKVARPGSNQFLQPKVVRISLTVNVYNKHALVTD